MFKEFTFSLQRVEPPEQVKARVEYSLIGKTMNSLSNVGLRAKPEPQIQGGITLLSDAPRICTTRLWLLAGDSTD